MGSDRGAYPLAEGGQSLRHKGPAPPRAALSDSIASLILIEPDLSLAERPPRWPIAGKLESEDPEALLETLLQDHWSSDLPQLHVKGLAGILSPGFQPARLNHDLIQSRNALHYASLSRRKVPALILYSQDGSESVRKDALYLQATLPAAETGIVDKGGACMLISSELNELLGMCHRIVVMHDGEINGVFDAAATSEEELIAFATGIRQWKNN